MAKMGCHIWDSKDCGHTAQLKTLEDGLLSCAGARGALSVKTTCSPSSQSASAMVEQRSPAFTNSSSHCSSSSHILKPLCMTSPRTLNVVALLLCWRPNKQITHHSSTCQIRLGSLEKRRASILRQDPHLVSGDVRGPCMGHGGARRVIPSWQRRNRAVLRPRLQALCCTPRRVPTAGLPRIL